MPIVDMTFENGVFFSREIGQVDERDARLWAEALHHCALSSRTPIVVLIDALQATGITSDARRVFARASETPNVRVAAIVTHNPRVTQQCRITALMGTVRSSHETHFFDTREEADQFVRSHSLSPAYSG